MAYSTISYGSTGSDVEKLQKSLNSMGYNLDVDGKFGEKTRNAVKDYQRKNNLTVDGIVGENTWGSINKSSSQNNKNNNNNKNKNKNKNNNSNKNQRPTYEKSDEVVSAEKELEKWENNAPDEYEGKYDAEIDEFLNKILNREQFSYDLESDPVYQQYRQLYINNGEKAMADTMGQAAALTGGYGSSYGQVAGQQAYHEYLEGLNDVAIELYDMAYRAYMDEGDKLIEDIELLRSLDGADYERYLDELDRYYADGEYLLERLAQMSDDEFEQFLQQVDAWEDDRDFQYQQEQDELDHEEFLREMEFKEKEAERDQQNKDRDYQFKKDQAKQSSSSSSSGSKDKDKDKDDDKKTDEYTVYPKTYKQFVALTGNPGILNEDMFYQSASKKKQYGSYENYLKVMYDKYAN